MENGDYGRTDGLGHGITVDLVLSKRQLVPFVEIADTIRLIESGDYFRVDTGFLPAGAVIDIDYSFWSHGASALLLDDLDVMVMTSSQANYYENSNDAIILGHASKMDANAGSWSYQFPESGSYSIIFDNSDEPNGGANDGSDIQVEIGVTSLTIPSLFGNLWTGWHQSKHHTDEGDFMSLDLGYLDNGDDIYYYIDGDNKGGSIWSAKEFDIMLMTKSNYDAYANDSAFSSIHSHYKEDGLIPVVNNFTLSVSDYYVLVADAQDGPDSNSAEANGDWVWEFIILSDAGPIENMQAEDDNYQNVVSVGTLSPPDSDGDGVRNGLDSCYQTPLGSTVDSTGCSSSQLDGDGDGVADASDQCPNTPNGTTVDSTGCAIVADSDGDGVANNNDQCPNTSAGETVDSTGCTVVSDTDGDGVEDTADQCANTPAGDTVDSTGCSIPRAETPSTGVAACSTLIGTQGQITISWQYSDESLLHPENDSVEVLVDGVLTYTIHPTNTAAIHQGTSGTEYTFTIQVSNEAGPNEYVCSIVAIAEVIESVDTDNDDTSQVDADSNSSETGTPTSNDNNDSNSGSSSDEEAGLPGFTSLLTLSILIIAAFIRKEN